MQAIVLLFDSGPSGKLKHALGGYSVGIDQADGRAACSRDAGM